MASSFDVISFKGSKLPRKYEPLLFSRWLRSLRFGSPLYKKMPSKEYFDNYHKFIENLLIKPDAIVRLAVLTEDHDNVLGFSVCREDVLDYVHVHTNNRRVGIAKALVPENITTFSHLTGPALVIWQSPASKYKHLKFNPFA